MADYITSAFVDAQAKITAGYAAHETREKEYPILAKGLENAPFLVQDVEKLKTGESRAVKGYQFSRISTGSGTARSHNFTGSQGDTAAVTLNWNIYTQEFSLYMKNGKDNVFSNSEMLQNQLTQAMRNNRTRLGSALVTQLHTDRTAHTTVTPLNATWNATTEAYEISDAELFFLYMQTVMEQNDYTNGLDVMVDPILSAKARYLANQGVANATNLGFQFMDMNIMPHTGLTPSIVTGYTQGGIAIAMPQYSFGYIPFVPSKYREGFGDGFGSFNGAGTAIADNIFGEKLTHTLRGYSVKADGSSNGGATDDILTHWQLSTEVAIQTADLSATDETPIYEFALVG